MPVPAEIVERYSYGECFWLACAIHRHLGWPMQAAIAEDGTMEWIAHAWVVRPDGIPIDIVGPYGNRDFLGGSEIREIIPLSEETLEIFTDEIPLEKVEAAWAVAQEFVLPLWGEHHVN
jgi:hypothetical protein